MTKTLIRSIALLATTLALACQAAEPPQASGPNGNTNGSAAKTAPGSPQAPSPEASLVDMVRALSQFLTEEEVQMVYDYLWDSSIATLKGSNEEITLPPDLVFKLAILQKRIEKEGGHYLEGLALKMEKDLAHWRESLNNPPPPPPYLLPSERAPAKQP